MTIWVWRCSQCAFTLELPAGTVPNIDSEIPHAKDGYLLSTDQLLEPANWCHSVEFIKVGEK